MKRSVVQCILMAFIVVGAISCQTTQSTGLTPEAEESIKNKVNAIWQQQAVDWSNGDIDGYMAAYWNSEKLRFASANTVVYGWQPTIERYKKRYSNPELMGKLTFTPIDITVYTESDAIIFGRYRLDRVEDGTPKSYEGLVTTTFRKMADGEWKIIYDHTSD